MLPGSRVQHEVLGGSNPRVRTVDNRRGKFLNTNTGAAPRSEFLAGSTVLNTVGREALRHVCSGLAV